MQRTHGALILARYSTDNQNPDSIEVQVDRCSAWCAEQGLPVLNIYADFATSGMKESRPRYDAMMQDLRRGFGDVVVIYDQSRMFRRMTSWFAFRDELSSLGVRVASVTQPQIGKDLRDPTNFLTEGSMALFNQIWVLQTRQKVVEKMQHMAREGKHTGGRPPLGYAVSGDRLVIQPQEAEIVRRIFSEYASGRSYREIIQGLNADGLRTRAGNPFGSNSLHELLHNPKYIGILEYGKSAHYEDGRRNSHPSDRSGVIRVEGAVPAIIDRAVFEEVQQRMADNRKSQAATRPATRREYPLRGKVFCAGCKSAMTIQVSRGKYEYYHCTGRRRKHDCDMPPIRASLLEERVAEAVRSLLGDPEQVDALLEILREQGDKAQAGAGDRLAALHAQDQAIAVKLNRAADAVLNGMGSAALAGKVRELERQQTEIRRQMDQLHAQVSAAALPEEKLREALALITSSHGDPAALLSIVARVEVDRDDITVWTILDAAPDGSIDPADPPSSPSSSGGDGSGSGSPAPDAPADTPETKSQGAPGGAPCTKYSWWRRGDTKSFQYFFHLSPDGRICITIPRRPKV